MILRIFSQEYTYTVKICDPERRSKFILRDMHNVSHKFASVRTLQSALYHEFDDQIPDGDFNVGYFEGSSHKKKWLVSVDDLTAMYAKFKGKKNIPLWCDGKEMPYDEDDEEEEHSRKKRKKNKDTLTKKVSEQEEELESVFQKLRGMHENKWSGPQYRLWARAIVSGVHESSDHPPNAPMFSGGIPKQQKESLVDAFAGAAKVIAKAFAPPTKEAENAPVHFSPSKKVDVRLKNLEQLRILKSLLEDGILSLDEFTQQKRIVLQELNNLS